MTTLQQPRAVRAVNALGASAARLGLRPRLGVDALLVAATKRTGLHDFGPDDFREGLQVLVESLEWEARLTTIGRVAARKRLIGLHRLHEGRIHLPLFGRGCLFGGRSLFGGSFFCCWGFFCWGFFSGHSVADISGQIDGGNRNYLKL